MLRKSPTSNLMYFGEQRSGRLDPQMGHLTCFIGGLYVLSAISGASNNESFKHQMDIAQGIGKTCRESYVRAGTGLGPEAFHFERADVEAKSLRENEKYYILRPETIETWFYLWRSTHEQIYRDWAWEAIIVGLRPRHFLPLMRSFLLCLEFRETLSSGRGLFRDQRCLFSPCVSRRCPTEFFPRGNAEISFIDLFRGFVASSGRVRFQHRSTSISHSFTLILVILFFFSC